MISGGVSRLALVLGTLLPIAILQSAQAPLAGLPTLAAQLTSGHLCGHAVLGSDYRVRAEARWTLPKEPAVMVVVTGANQARWDQWAGWLRFAPSAGPPFRLESSCRSEPG